MVGTPVAESAQGWNGWHRPAGARRWVVVASAPDYGEAWRRLLDKIPGLSGSWCVLAAGKHPDDDNAPNPRRPRLPGRPPEGRKQATLFPEERR
jgi:hypothetical protein